MTVLFPSIKPNKTYYWEVDAIHTLYIEESGNPEGLPVLCLHGGPGGASAAFNRQFFDPNVFRIIQFDQRGCGQSTPHAELGNNMTEHLIADIEFIREKLSVDQWILFGGSWGSTLALVYTLQHPDSVVGLILRGIFLAREKDINWFFQSGADRFYPQQWQKFVGLVPQGKRDKLISAYYDLLTGSNELKRMAAAKAWAGWEANCSSILSDDPDYSCQVNPHSALSLARLECHYMLNRCFIEENYILDRIHTIGHIPAVLVHGRYDMICPIEQAYALNQNWENSTLRVISAAGHTATEKTTLAALVEATSELKFKLA